MQSAQSEVSGFSPQDERMMEAIVGSLEKDVDIEPMEAMEEIDKYVQKIITTDIGLAKEVASRAVSSGGLEVKGLPIDQKRLQTEIHRALGNMYEYAVPLSLGIFADRSYATAALKAFANAVEFIPIVGSVLAKPIEAATFASEGFDLAKSMAMAEKIRAMSGPSIARDNVDQFFEVTAAVMAEIYAPQLEELLMKKGEQPKGFFAKFASKTKGAIDRVKEDYEVLKSTSSKVSDEIIAEKKAAKQRDQIKDFAVHVKDAICAVMTGEAFQDVARKYQDNGALRNPEAQKEFLTLIVSQVTTATRQVDLYDSIAERLGFADRVIIGRSGNALKDMMRRLSKAGVFLNEEGREAAADLTKAMELSSASSLTGSRDSATPGVDVLSHLKGGLEEARKLRAEEEEIKASAPRYDPYKFEEESKLRAEEEIKASAPRHDPYKFEEESKSSADDDHDLDDEDRLSLSGRSSVTIDPEEERGRSPIKDILDKGPSVKAGSFAARFESKKKLAKLDALEALERAKEAAKLEGEGRG